MTHTKFLSLIPWDDIENEAQKQIEENLAHPFLVKMAIMPDVHAGYDLPIGGVALLKDVISPSYVGYDIGCGMCHIRTTLKVAQLPKDFLEKAFKEIVKQIPTGFTIHTEEKPYKAFPNAANSEELAKRVQDKLGKSLGTLGGGNHFIELGVNTTGNLCVTLHSGSRNVGHSIADYYMKQSRFLDLHSELGQAYLTDMQFALDYALDNRKEMLTTILKILGDPEVELFINENHNHAEVTSEGVLHRKGATPANVGQLGIIPANMRDGVFITEGLGNIDYLSSASHGCGRVMSRNQARKNIAFDKFAEEMSNILSNFSEKTLDEAPQAYKDAEQVIAAQHGIVVNIVDKVAPLANIKG